MAVKPVGLEEVRRKAGWGFWLRWVLANAGGMAVAFIMGLTLETALDRAIYKFEPGVVGQAIFMIVTFGFLIGAVQYLVLRQHIRRAGWWLMACVVGMIVAMTVYSFIEARYVKGDSYAALLDATKKILFPTGRMSRALYERLAEWWPMFRQSPRPEQSAIYAVTTTVTDTLRFAVVWLVFGLLAGIMQYLILRPYASRAGWWILASAAGATVCMILVWLLISVVKWSIMSTDESMPRATAEIIGRLAGYPVGGAVSGVITGAVLVGLLRHPVSGAEKP